MLRKPDPLLEYLERPSQSRLTRVVRAYHRFVWEVAYRVTANPEDAADISQDVFLKLLLEPPGPGSVRSPAGYLAWRALGRARYLQRAGERRRSRERAFVERLGARDLPEEDVEALSAAVAELPEELRLAVELRFHAGLPPGRIGEILQVSERAVFQRLEKGRDLLRRRLSRLSPAILLAGNQALSVQAPPPPPENLLPALLAIAAKGYALSAPSAAAAGIISQLLTLKIGLAAALLLGTLGAGAGWHAWLRSERHSRPVANTPERPLEIAGVREPAPAPPGPTPAAGAPVDGAAAEPPRAALRGVVLDELGDPVAGARVLYLDNLRPEEIEALRGLGFRDVPEGEIRLETSSGIAGEYEFSGLLPGRAHVQAAVESLFMDGMPEVYPRSGETIWKELRLSYFRRLHGMIRDRNGTPLDGGLVFLHNSNIHDAPILLGRPPFQHHGGVQADSLGRYDTGLALMGIERGADFRVAAWANGHAMLQKRPKPSDFQGLEARVDFELEPEMPVTLLVAEPSGKPVEDAEVGWGDEQIIYSHDRPYPATLTDSSGRACVEHFPQKENSIRVSREGYHPAAVKVAPGASTDVPVTLFPLGEPIEAEVVPGEGILAETIQDVRVSLYWLNREGEFVSPGGVKCEHRPDSRRYLFWPREPGTYRIAYRFRGRGCETDSFEYNGKHAVLIQLPIDASPSPPWIAGIVVRAKSGEPVGDAVVQANYFPRGQEPSRWDGGSFLHLGRGRDFFFPAPAGGAQSAAIGADGRFLLELPVEEPSTVILHTRSKEDWFNFPESDRLWCSGEVALEIDASSMVEAIRIEVPEGGAIHGVVVGENGEPQPGEVVAVYDGRVAVRCQTASLMGRFRFDNLIPGAYALEALGRASPVRVGHGSWSADVEGLPEPGEFFERRIVVAEGQETEVAIDLARDHLGIIEGAVDPAWPELSCLNFGMLIGGRPRASMPFGGQTDVVNGRFRIEGLHPGRYRVWAAEHDRHEERILVVAETEVARGRVSRVSIAPPLGILLVPFPAGWSGGSGGARLVRVEWMSGEGGGGTPLWQPAGGYRVEELPAHWRIEGVLEGPVRVSAIAPGRRETWSEPARVRGGSETGVRPFQLEGGSRIIVTVETRGGTEPPPDLRFVVSSEHRQVGFTAESVEGKPVWILSAFAPGEYSVQALLGEKILGIASLAVYADRDAEATVRLDR